jgi:hypothetical protein
MFHRPQLQIPSACVGVVQFDDGHEKPREELPTLLGVAIIARNRY